MSGNNIIEYLESVPSRIHVTSDERHFLLVLVEDVKKLVGEDPDNRTILPGGSRCGCGEVPCICGGDPV